MSEWSYIGAAYGVTWVALAAYGVYLARRRSRAAADLAKLDGGGR